MGKGGRGSCRATKLKETGSAGALPSRGGSSWRFVIVVIALAGDFNPRNEIGYFLSLPPPVKSQLDISSLACFNTDTLPRLRSILIGEVEI